MEAKKYFLVYFPDDEEADAVVVDSYDDVKEAYTDKLKGTVGGKYLVLVRGAFKVDVSDVTNQEVTL